MVAMEILFLMINYYDWDLRAMIMPATHDDGDDDDDDDDNGDGDGDDDNN